MEIDVENLKPSSYEHHNGVAVKAALFNSEGNAENIVPIDAEVVVDLLLLCASRFSD